MKMNHNFAAGKWDASDFEYVYSPICTEYPKFTQLPDCIANQHTADGTGFQYISMVTKKTFSPNIRIRTVCEFDAYGAPLIVISGDLRRGGDGVLRYGLHHEFVAFEEGCNVWRIVPWPARTQTPIYPIKAAFFRTPVPAGQPVELVVEVRETQISASINGVSCAHFTPELAPQLHVGITACEGINRFRCLEIETL